MTDEVRDEERMTEDINIAVVEKKVSQLQMVLQKHCLWKTLQITAWETRYLLKTTGNPKGEGALQTHEIKEAEKYWAKITQRDDMMSNTKHEVISGRLRSQGRIVGDHQIYLPTNSELIKLIIQDAHLRTLHWGVGLTMAKLREIWWVVVNTEIHRCNQCKHYRIKPLAAPPTSALLKFRTQEERTFQTMGADFAGPVR